MLAPSRVTGVKLPADALASIQRDLRISQESEEDVALFRLGRRLVNRQGDRRKDKFILNALRSDFSLEGATDVELLDEAEVRWSWDVERAQANGLRKIVENEIRRAFELAGVEPPAICNVHAETILFSDYQAKPLEAVHPAEVAPVLVDAHLRSLGYTWPARVRSACARRIAIVLMNGHLWDSVGRTTFDEELENDALETI